MIMKYNCNMLTQITQLQGWRPLQPCFCLVVLTTSLVLAGNRGNPRRQTCASVSQQWHKPRSANIDPEPGKKCTFVKAPSDQGGKRKLAPVTCKLYDARGKHLKLNGWKQQYVMEMCHYLSKGEKHYPFSYLLSDQECSWQCPPRFNFRVSVD